MMMNMTVSWPCTSYQLELSTTVASSKFRNLTFDFALPKKHKIAIKGRPPRHKTGLKVFVAPQSCRWSHCLRGTARGYKGTVMFSTRCTANQTQSRCVNRNCLNCTTGEKETEGKPKMRFLRNLWSRRCRRASGRQACRSREAESTWPPRTQGICCKNRFSHPIFLSF